MQLPERSRPAQRWAGTLLLLLCAMTASAAQADRLEQARNELLDGDYEAGIAIYRSILASDAVAAYPEALEYLGVALEKSGRADQALARYRDCLQRFPASTGAARVRQRYAALEASMTAAAAPAPPPRVADQVAGVTPEPAPATARGPEPKNRDWAWFGGLSQDLWFDSYQIDGVEREIERSQVLTFANFGLRGQTDRLDVRARLDAGYLHTLSGYEGRDLNQLQVNRALVGVTDEPTGLGIEAGRQSLYQDGVLGRFDGVRGSWRFRDQTHFYVTAGTPVDAPRFQGDSRRPFVSFSAAQEGLFDQLDVRAFAVLRQVEGRSDREAIGGEVRWHRDRWQVVANLDYDLSYQALNSALVHGQLTLTDRIRLFARTQSYALPFISTGNALIGQPFGTVDDLADAEGFSDPQLRTLGRDRTSDVWQSSGGFSWTLSQRWYANGSVTYTDTDGSIASGTVAARPRRQEFFSRVNLIGSSVFRDSDTVVLGYQLQSTTTSDTNSLRFELRLPFGRPFGGALRINPMLNLGLRDAAAPGDQQIFIEPGLRLTFRYARRYRLELMGRGRWTSRELPTALQDTGLFEDDQLDSSAYFLQLGWRVDL